MKNYVLGTFFFLALLWPRVSSAQFEELDRCVGSAESRWEAVEKRIPLGWLDWDRGLWAMGQEVQALKENDTHLKKLQASGSPIDEVMVGNAVEFCRGFERQLASKIQRFYLLGLCFIALAIVLTVDFVMIMFSANDAPNPAPSGKPTDR